MQRIVASPPESMRSTRASCFLRKMIRGGSLTDEERALLDRVSRKPTGSGEPLTQEQIETLLSERARADG